MKNKIVFTETARVKMKSRDVIKLTNAAKSKISSKDNAGHLIGNFFYKIIKNSIFIF